MKPAKFEWDKGNANKCRKHGIELEDVEHVFRGDPLVLPDVKHSGAEDRFIAIGRTVSGRPAFVAFTLRMKHGVEVVRPISARHMHEKELKAYEKSTKA